jgi:hypothetical protein
MEKNGTKMKNKINNIIRENLIRRAQINERFERISIIETKELRFISTMNYLNELVDNGYTKNDIEDLINEEENLLKKLFGWGKTASPEDKKVHSKVVNTVSDGGLSWFKEYAIATFLGFLGFKGPLANSIATAFSEMSVMDIISVFRSKAGCLAHSSTVSRAVAEALTRYIIETSMEEDSTAANFFRNMIFSSFKQAGWDKAVGNFLCNAAYKSAPTIIAGVKKNLK